MKQYCRYCNHLVAGDVIYCTMRQTEMSHTQATAVRKVPCKDFELNPKDALGINKREYKPRVRDDRPSPPKPRRSASGADDHRRLSGTPAVKTGFMTRGWLLKEVKKRFKEGDKVIVTMDTQEQDENRKKVLVKKKGTIEKIGECFTEIQLKHHRTCILNIDVPELVRKVQE